MIVYMREFGGRVHQTEISPTLEAASGTGGNNVPIVLIEDQVLNTIALEGNGQRPSHKGDGWNRTDKMYTLNATEIHAVAYRIGSYYSNSMLSVNPNSGIYKTDMCNTLDAINCGYPGCNQGGIIIVETKRDNS